MYRDSAQGQLCNNFCGFHVQLMAPLQLCLGQAREVQEVYVHGMQMGYPQWESPQAHISTNAAKVVYV